MNNSWQIYNEPPNFWPELCRTHNSLFHTSGWQNVLKRAFKAVPLFVYNSYSSQSFALTIFPAGPFRIAYIGFPAGRLLSGKLTDNFVEQLESIRWPKQPHLLRLQVSPFVSTFNLPGHYEETWETIVPLHNWDSNKLKARVRRDVRVGERNSVVIKNAELVSTFFLADLYRQTVRLHGGSLRYNNDYFYEIIELGRVNKNLQCWLATYREQNVAFLVAALESDTVFYLHGGIDRKFRQIQPSDLLIYNAIQWAITRGANTFNMMSSPLSQMSLVKYKEKWGGISDKLRTYEWPISPFPATIFNYALKGYNLINRLTNW